MPLSSETHSCFDAATSFLYLASISRALVSLRSKCTGAKKVIRMFVVMRGAGDLFDICIRAANVAQCSIELHAVCLSSDSFRTAEMERIKQKKKMEKEKKKSMLSCCYVHEVETLLEAHGHAIHPSQLPKNLRAVQRSGRLLVSDALGAFGGNSMIAEIMSAAAILFLKKSGSERKNHVEEEREGEGAGEGEGEGEGEREREREREREEGEEDEEGDTPLMSGEEDGDGDGLGDKPQGDGGDDDEGTTNTSSSSSSYSSTSSSSSSTSTSPSTSTSFTSSTNIVIPSRWRSHVAPAYMPGAYAMIHLMRHSLDEPFVVQVTDVARLMAKQKVAWSYQIGNVQPPNVKISKVQIVIHLNILEFS